MISKVTLTYLLLVIALIHLAEASFSDVPPPPQRPAYFRTKDDMLKYLHQVYQYHTIVGRWRLRRGTNGDDHPPLNALYNDFFQFLDINHDNHISSKELAQRLNFHKED